MSVKNIRDFSSNFVKYSRNQLKELQKAISSAQKYECEQKLQANISYRALENEKSLLVGYSSLIHSSNSDTQKTRNSPQALIFKNPSIKQESNPNGFKLTLRPKVTYQKQPSSHELKLLHSMSTLPKKIEMFECNENQPLKSEDSPQLTSENLKKLIEDSSFKLDYTDQILKSLVQEPSKEMKEFSSPKLQFDRLRSELKVDSLNKKFKVKQI